MSTIKSSTEHLTLNADGSGKDIKFQANGVEVASISSTGNLTSTGIDDNATSTAITIDASENVGIGVTPETWQTNKKALQVGKRGALFGHTTASDVGFSENHYRNISGTASYIDTAAASLIDQADGVINLRVAPSGTADSAISWTTAMTIDNSGGAILNGSATIDSSHLAIHQLASKNGITFKAPGTSAYMGVQFQNSSGTRIGYIQYSNTATAFSTSSDYRLKELDVPMVGSIDRLKLLRPINFAWKIDGSRTDGFLAHEAGEVVPECATGTKDAMRDEEYEITPAVMDGETVVTEAVMGTRSVPDYQGIDQSKLVPLLVASLQEAIARIEVLENA